MNPIIIDVREKHEFAKGHVDRAINYPLSKLNPVGVDDLSLATDAEIIVYCNSGRRSEIAAKVLRGKGYAKVLNGVNQEVVDKILKNS